MDNVPTCDYVTDLAAGTKCGNLLQGQCMRCKKFFCMQHCLTISDYFQAVGLTSWIPKKGVICSDCQDIVRKGGLGKLKQYSQEI